MVGTDARMLDFGHFDFGQFDIGQLAEIELSGSRGTGELHFCLCEDVQPWSGRDGPKWKSPTVGCK